MITAPDKHPQTAAIPTDALQRDFDYFRAQSVLTEMLREGLISQAEFNKITALNRDTFYPFWAEIMPKIA